jgi:glycosyltransferase involved in cell wall biosynthesis
MRILWVKAGRLLPVDTGGKSRSYNLLRQLAGRHGVVLLSYYDGPRDRDYEVEVGRHLPGAVTVNTGKAEPTALGRGFDYLRRLPSTAPYAVTKHSAPKIRRMIARWLAEDRFDVAVCDFLAPSLNFPRQLRPAMTPVVLFQHNVESALWRRQADYAPNLVKWGVYNLEAAKMLRYERTTVGRFAHVIAVSENDRDQMAQMIVPPDPARISVAPTGVDLWQYRPEPGESATEPLVIFLGSMDWEANIDGVDYFCREVWPRVRAAVPDARFRIVGRNPDARVKRLASESVEVTGTVSSVIEHLREAAVFVVPLRIGGGTRLKIYEAMAAGKAVVSTTVGAEGLDINDGRDILLADDAEGFGQFVIKLLRDRQLRQQFEQAAARLAARYDWSEIAVGFEAVLARVAREQAASIKAVEPHPLPNANRHIGTRG